MNDLIQFLLEHKTVTLKVYPASNTTEPPAEKEGDQVLELCTDSGKITTILYRNSIEAMIYGFQTSLQIRREKE